MILFLDSNVLIYILEGDANLAVKVKQTIQNIVSVHGEIALAISALTRLSNP
uniref:Uncharacterized protein n=1 Tax=Chlorobium phaeobacteroides (strain BS1) TaxID=331678 RepID=B3EMD9_CHLPB